VTHLLVHVLLKLKDRLGVSASELAEVMTSQAFEQSAGQLSADGLLNFDAFSAWCAHNNEGGVGLVKEQEEEEEEEDEEEEDSSFKVSLQEISAATGLNAMEVDAVFEAFAEIADGNGVIGRSDFGEVRDQRNFIQFESSSH
jgi:hypothetical protein